MPGGAGMAPPPRFAPGGGTMPRGAAGWGPGAPPLFLSPSLAFRSLMSRAPGRFEDWDKGGTSMRRDSSHRAAMLSKDFRSMG